MKLILSFLFSVICFAAVITEILCQSNQAAMNLAGRASSGNSRVGQPIFGFNGGGSGNNGRNWNAYGSGGVGTKVWESPNGRHSVGVAGNYAQSYGRFQGQGYKSRPDYGAGAGYTYRFGR